MRLERQEILVERAEMIEHARVLNEALVNLVAQESAILEKKGYPVGSDGRLLMEKFIGFYGQEDIKHDSERVKRAEKGFEHFAVPPDVFGGLLEKSKMIAVNRFWFGGRFITVRTASYDDYFNGVDELIFDKKTFQPIAAVDTTTNPLQSGKPEALVKKIIAGSPIRYGVKISDQEVEKCSYSALPVFVIKIDPEALLLLGEDLIAGGLSEESKDLEKKVLSSLREQREKFITLVDKGLRQDYEKLGKVLEEVEQ